MIQILSQADRELIATYVSHLNDCTDCQRSHGAIAAVHLGGNEELVEIVKRDFESAPIGEKLKALLAIAGKIVSACPTMPEHRMFGIVHASGGKF